MTDFGDAFQKAYSTIVFRDLTYVIIGAIPLSFLVYFERVYAPFMDSPALAALAFGFASYIAGVALFHAGVLMPWRFGRIWLQRPFDPRSYEIQQVEFQTQLIRVTKNHPDAMRNIERIIYIIQINGGIGIALVVSLILWVLYAAQGVVNDYLQTCKGYMGLGEGVPPLWLPVLMGILIYTSYRTNRSRAEILADLLAELDKLKPLPKANQPADL